MWKRFTEQAKRLVYYAQEDAAQHGLTAVDTEHLLIGLLLAVPLPPSEKIWPPPLTNNQPRRDTALLVLETFGLDLQALAGEVARQASRTDSPQKGVDMELAARGKYVVDFAYQEMRGFGNDYIGTEHILLGLIREEQGLAGRVLSQFGVTVERTRREVVQWQGGTALPPDPALRRPWWRIFGP